VANLKLTAGSPSKIVFRFYDEQGQLLTGLSSVSANLYSSATGSLISSGLPLTYDSTNQYYYLIYTPPTTLSGTYYFVALGIHDGIERRAIVFVDILPSNANISLINYDQVIKFINDINVDYSVLPSLIYTATEWVQDLIGRIILPKSFKEKLPVVDGKVYLNYFPLLSIVSLTDKEGNLLTDYSIESKELGILEVKESILPTERKKLPFVVVEYIAGYDPIPDTIYTAIGMIVGYLYDRAKYMNFDRIRMLGVEGILAKDVLLKVKEILTPYIKVV